MNTQLPVQPRPSSSPSTLLTPQNKPGQARKNSQSKIGQRADNLSLRYPKDLERCFVLGNN